MNVPPLRVRRCPDGNFRVFCPFETRFLPTTEAGIFVFLLATVSFPILLSCCCCFCWMVDRERKSPVTEDVLDKIKRDPRLVEPELQREYAKSWLEGRFMGEDWESARGKKVLALSN